VFAVAAAEQEDEPRAELGTAWPSSRRFSAVAAPVMDWASAQARLDTHLMGETARRSVPLQPKQDRHVS
jgi:hypothetical protein